MAKGSTARRYAQAVFQIALERNQLEQWQKDLTAIAGVFGDPQAAIIFTSKSIRFPDKEKLLASLFEGMNPMAMNLARILVLKDGTGAAIGIAEEYLSMLDKQRGVQRGEVVAAIDLTPEQQATMARTLEKIVGQKVALSARKDPIVVGGFVARVGGKIVDGSVRTKLLNLQKDLQQSGG